MESKSCLSEVPLQSEVWRLHSRLRTYNLKLRSQHPTLPGWTGIHTSEDPAPYWSLLADMLSRIPPVHCLEIGAGAGDVTVLLSHYASGSVVAVERDPELASYCEEKLNHLGRTRTTVVAASYPVAVDPQPDLVVMVNCVYADTLSSRTDYAERLRVWRTHNGVPQRFIFEAIDPCPGGPEYPSWIRLGPHDVRQIFPECRITAHDTYRPPRNRTAKTMYVVEEVS